MVQNHHRQQQQPPGALVLACDTDWSLSVNEHRVLVQQRSSTQHDDDDGWTVLSHAVLNGGCCRTHTRGGKVQVLNARVPADYDGVHPDPRDFLREYVEESSDDHSTTTTTNTTIGLLTAASMQTVRVVSLEATDAQQSNKYSVDAIVTAGISNARAAGATADSFAWGTMADDDDDDDAIRHADPTTTPSEKDGGQTDADASPLSSSTFGTINTIVIITAPVSETALVEAFTVAIEAKCRALQELGIVCQKNPMDAATGTGTDSTVVVCKHSRRNSHTNVAYAGKHTILGELIGQAVREATQQAVECNLRHVYGSNIWGPSVSYRIHCLYRQVRQAIVQGHRPWVPSKPMQPVPRPNSMVACIGLLGFIFALGIHLVLEQTENDVDCRSPFPSWKSIILHPSSLTPFCSVIVAVLVGDRYLGSLMLPLVIHPVVWVGSLISFLLRCVPESHFDSKRNPVVGFLTGVWIFGTTVMVSLSVAALLMASPLLLQHGWVALFGNQTDATCSSFINDPNYQFYFYSGKALTWSLHVYVVRGSLSLQLLCSVALQMAHFLERHQLSTARTQLSWLCSRDPSTLQEDELAGATLESLAENLSDSVTSPLFYYVMFGPLGAFGFRVMNTLDSRLGFRDERREYVGKLSARWDDMLNLIPARLTAVVLAASSWPIVRNNSRSSGRGAGTGSGGVHLVALRGLRVAWRDAGMCDSPNAGWPMATMAGVLGVRLEKRGQYALNSRGYDGVSAAAPTYDDIRRGHTIAEVAGMLLFGLAWMVVATKSSEFRIR